MLSGVKDRTRMLLNANSIDKLEKEQNSEKTNRVHC